MRRSLSMPFSRLRDHWMPAAVLAGGFALGWCAAYVQLPAPHSERTTASLNSSMGRMTTGAGEAKDSTEGPELPRKVFANEAELRTALAGIMAIPDSTSRQIRLLEILRSASADQIPIMM